MGAQDDLKAEFIFKKEKEHKTMEILQPGQEECKSELGGECWEQGQRPFVKEIGMNTRKSGGDFQDNGGKAPRHFRDLFSYQSHPRPRVQEGSGSRGLF